MTEMAPRGDRPLRYDEDDANPTNKTVAGPSIGEIIDRRFSRRTALKGLFGGAAAVVAGGALTSGLLGTTGLAGAAHAAGAAVTTLGFTEVPVGYTTTDEVAPGYSADVLIRWGDKVLADAPAFDPAAQTAEAQRRQFGYNNDFIGFMPLPAGSDNSDHGLLVVNHEYTSAELMFPGVTEDTALTEEQVAAEIAAHGVSVIEVKRTGGKWAVVEGSRYARRIDTGTTPMLLTGPAAGHDRLKTTADATGTKVVGTINNCAGGVTPWGTVLTAEENFHGYFTGTPAGAEEANHKRYGITTKPWFQWHRFDARFNIDANPTEPNRFGWIVEIDPYDPASMPKKRTALGRMKHEAANVHIAEDGTVVAYMGDDERFEYLYRFVASAKFDRTNPTAARDILDDGRLSVAKFSDDGALEWLPLDWGQGPLTAANGFTSPADLLIETRRAADLVGATRMDRPEDVEPNPVTGKVYVMLTNNNKRTADQIDAANPRAKNETGQVIELTAPDGDHTASRFTWDMFLVAGNAADGAVYGAGTTEAGQLYCPDNCAFDNQGRLWITTDQGSAAGKRQIADGVYATDTTGAGRAVPRHFYRVPTGAEMCGPCFTPDNTTLFVAVQHPGEDKGSSFDTPSTRWPDFKDGVPPRPSVVAITKADGGVIGG